MGDLVGAATHIPTGSKPDASWMKIEPTAGDRLVENRKPVGRLYSAASAMRATSLTQVGGRRSRSPSRRVPLARAIAKGGLGRVRRVAATLFQCGFEARSLGRHDYGTGQQLHCPAGVPTLGHW